MKKFDQLPTLHEIISGQQDELHSNDNSLASLITGPALEIIPRESVPILKTVNMASSQVSNNSPTTPFTSEGNIVMEWARRKAMINFYNLKITS
jgi:hypothetical protein